MMKRVERRIRMHKIDEVEYRGGLEIRMDEIDEVECWG